MAVYELREHDALGVILGALQQRYSDFNSAELLCAGLDALSQMCMDDGCATAVRQHHPEGFALAGALLFELRGSGKQQLVGLEQRVNEVRCSAARFLRFLFAVERNRKIFKEAFSADVMTPFVDIGNYVWHAEAYQQFVNLVGSLPERETSQLHEDFQKACKRGAVSHQHDWPDGGAGVQEHVGMHLGDARPPGYLVGGYELLECVGAGAFGRVHLARREDMPGEFALKEVPLNQLADLATLAPSRTPTAPPGQPSTRRPSRCSTPRGARDDEDDSCPGVEMGGGEMLPQDQVAKGISQEVRLLRQLDHPNIVQYHSSFTTGAQGSAATTLWIVMEFCNGVALQVFVASAKEKGFTQLPEEQTWQIFVQICLALRYLHVDKGIVHRDLTPNNVLVQTHTLAVKVADFGLARQKLGGTQGASMMKSMVGTILYLCPEIVQHQPYTNKADVWALGCLLYKMATLRDPFSGTNPLSVARKIVESEYEQLDLSTHSEMLISTCQRCLTVTPDDRPDITAVCQLVTPALIKHLEDAQRLIVGHNQRLQSAALTHPTSPLSITPLAAHMQRTTSPAPTLALTPVAAKEVSVGIAPKANRRPPMLSDASSPPRPSPRGTVPHSVSSTHASESLALTGLSSTGEEQHTLSAPSLYSPMCSAATPRSVRSQSLDVPDGRGGRVKVPRRVLRTVTDPVQAALLLSHRLAFVGQLPPERAGRSDVGRAIVDRYHRWLFGSGSRASLLKREISKLMQRSSEQVDFGDSADSGLPTLTYSQLYEHLLNTCTDHGYDEGAETGAGGEQLTTEGGSCGVR